MWKTPEARKTNLQNEVKISDDYANYRTEFMNMLSELVFMLDGHLGSIEAALHRIELSPEDTRLGHFAQY